MGSAADRLADKLDEAEDRILKLERDLEDERNRRPWTAHVDIEEDDLPVPRLEMRWEEGDFPRGYNWRCCYRLVYRHFLGHLIGVPLGETLRGGSKAPDETGLDDLPFRDGAHLKHEAKSLGLRAFVRYDGEVHEVEIT